MGELGEIPRSCRPAPTGTVPVVDRNRQAVVVRPDDCHGCGLCVAACPERALRLVPRAA